MYAFYQNLYTFLDCVYYWRQTHRTCLWNLGQLRSAFTRKKAKGNSLCESVDSEFEASFRSCQSAAPSTQSVRQELPPSQNSSAATPTSRLHGTAAQLGNETLSAPSVDDLRQLQRRLEEKDKKIRKISLEAKSAARHIDELNNVIKDLKVRWLHKD